MTENETRFDGNGNYARAGDGQWRYSDGRDLVPGARDLLLDELFPAEEVRVDSTRWRRVPRAWLRRRTDHPLAWVTAAPMAESGSGSTGFVDDGDAVLVPASVWLRHARDVVGMMAPELHPAALLGSGDVATMAEVSRPTLRAYLHRRQMPEPVVRVGGSPLWTRPVVERWLASRRGGARGSGPLPIARHDREASAP